MLGISFLRILRNAFRNFRRNVWLSLATTVVMVLTLLMMSFLYFANVLGEEVLKTIEQKVDLSAQFKKDASDEQIAIVAEDISSREDVEEVRIISSEQALEIFRRRHADDPYIEESLRELGENPLSASMFVVAIDPRFYQNIARQLESETYAPYIENVNYKNSRDIIDRLINFMSTIRNVALMTTLIFASLVILIMFNTIRLAIYSFREEIDIMRLVGASNWFIRGPFIIEAMLVAALGVAVTCFILYLTLNGVAEPVQRYFFPDQADPFNIYQHAVTNWVTVIGLQAILAVCLAVLSSFIAIRRYLR